MAAAYAALGIATLVTRAEPVLGWIWLVAAGAHLVIAGTTWRRRRAAGAAAGRATSPHG